MNYQLDGTNLVVVNSSSVEEAATVLKHFGHVREKEVFLLKDRTDLHAPKMFINCVMDVESLEAF
jgi:hypothetical protein